jgi:hypothetical protein
LADGLAFVVVSGYFRNIINYAVLAFLEFIREQIKTSNQMV